MKVVILAGGLGTRLSEETDLKPKPMVEVGGRPIIWHIMKIYSHYGFNDFIVCCGYKGYVLKEYFANYFLHGADVTIDLIDNKIDIHQSNVEPWKITLIDTGLKTMTGGRIKRIQPYIGNETFMLAYGDCLSDINLLQLVDFHKNHKKLATVTVVQPSGRFGAIKFDETLDGKVSSFQEKPIGDNAWINGGFFVLEPGIFKYIDDDNTIWERKPMEALTSDEQLFAYKHFGFWKPMDTLREKFEMENLWESNTASWKIWK